LVFYLEQVVELMVSVGCSEIGNGIACATEDDFLRGHLWPILVDRSEHSPDLHIRLEVVLSLFFRVYDVARYLRCDLIVLHDTYLKLF